MSFAPLGLGQTASASSTSSLRPSLSLPSPSAGGLELPFSLGADQAWFDFVLFGQSASAFGTLSVYAFTGTEEVSAPYSFSIELVSNNSNLDITSALGKEALLTIADRSGKKRLVHGVIRRMEQLHTANVFTHYQCEVVPRLWFLAQTQEHKIYQNQDVVEIITDVLKKHKFLAEAYSFKLRESYPKRTYCVQYGESDLHFLCRICEEEGIFFYFEHSEKGHCLCFSDAEGGPAIPGESRLRFYPGSGNPADTAVVSRLRLRHQINSDIATYREWNFTTPAADLTGQEDEKEWEKAPTPLAMRLETYQFPHLYQEKKEGERYAAMQLQRQLTFRQWIECESDVSRHLPGFTFTLYDHPREDANRKWWVVSVHHEGQQPQVLEHEAPDGRGMHYKSGFTAIPDDTRFVPAVRHKKIRIEGVQSAIVTGPKGEEIYPDEYGRVKVQFHWDRAGKHDERTTCWVRVAQGWAGSSYGAMAIPRIGHEVLVEFMEGDPDRPVITGRMYNAVSTVPYKLPEHKTRTVFKSMSTPGKENEPRGFNELRIEDKKGAEEIYAHAEKDVNLYVKHDWKEHILHDQHRTVDNFTYLETKGEDHATVRGARKTELFSDDNTTVHGTRHEALDDKWLVKVGNEVHIRAGIKVVLEAGAEITAKAGGSFVKIDASGVWINGARVSVNAGGSPGVGSGAAAVLPSLPNDVAKAAPPVQEVISFPVPKAMEECMSNAADDGSMFASLDGSAPAPEGTLYAAAASTTMTDAGGAPAWDKEKSLQHLRDHAHESYKDAKGKCATFVREAIEAGGPKLERPTSGSAADYGPSLEKIGFSAMPDGTIPQASDVVVIQSPGANNPHGHISMFDGTQWISDFKENHGTDVYPGKEYRQNKPSYTIYRRE